MTGLSGGNGSGKMRGKIIGIGVIALDPEMGVSFIERYATRSSYLDGFLDYSRAFREDH
jgi:hypothetical protein